MKQHIHATICGQSGAARFERGSHYHGSFVGESSLMIGSGNNHTHTTFGDFGLHKARFIEKTKISENGCLVEDEL